MGEKLDASKQHIRYTIGMDRSFKIVFAALLFLGFLSLGMPNLSAAEEDQDSTKEISGKIVSINAQESSLKIQYSEDAKNKTYRTSVFYVDDDSDILRGEAPCELTDLKSGENVFIEYVHQASGKDMVVTLSVGEQARDSD